MTSDLYEANQLADSIRKALNTQIPTFIKRADRNSYVAENYKTMHKLGKELFDDLPIESAAEVTLLEDKIEEQHINL